MVKRSKSEFNLTTTNTSKLKRSGKHNNEKLQFKENYAKMNSLVRSLETSLNDKAKSDEMVMKQRQHDDELKKKLNKQVMNVLQKQQQQKQQQACSQNDVSPSYSTISMVHLQYKYEELLSSHEGLLKLLETKVREVKKSFNENERLVGDIRELRFNLDEQQRTINKICDKYMEMKERKEKKMRRIRFERDAFKMAHDKLVALLNIKSGEEIASLNKQLAKTSDCFKALLINEIKRTKFLEYENFALKQNNAQLLNAKRIK